MVSTPARLTDRSLMSLPLLFKKVMFRVRRAVWRVLTTVSPDKIASFRLPGGARFEYPLKSAIGEHLFAGWFEPAEIAFVLDQLNAGDIVVDLGANAGLYTVIAARAVGSTGHVYAFEPGQRALALLRRNIAINGLDNVTVIEAAVSNVSGQASFAVATDTALSSLADVNRSDQQVSAWETVRTVRLDDAIAEYRIPAVTFIKMDVEGAEKLALEGAPNILARAAPALTILFEAFDQNTRAFGYTVRELLEWLQARGFSVQGFDESLTLRPIEHLRAAIGSTVYNFVASKT